MSHWPRLLLVTDQSANNRAMRAFVEGLLAELDDVADSRLRHVYIPRESLVPGKIGVVRAKLLVECRKLHLTVPKISKLPVVILRDSEARSDDWLKTQRAALLDLGRMLAEPDGSCQGFRNWPLTFNPMSEGALLAFPGLLRITENLLRVEIPVQLVREKEARRYVSKDRLEEALDLTDGANKRRLDEHLGRHIAERGAGPAADHAVEVLNSLRAFLRGHPAAGV